MRKLIFLLMLALALAACAPVYKFIKDKTGVHIPEDNFIEEMAEDYVCKEAGVCQDFTPDSKE